MTPTTVARKRRRYAKRLPKAERQEHLLDAALRVLAREGYERVSIDAIAREAGVTRPVVYGAYDGLEPLLHALLDRSQQRALDSALRLMPPSDTSGRVEDWLVEAAGAFIDLVQAEPDVWRPILGLTRNPPAVVRERIEATEEFLRQQIAAGLAAGLPGRGLDTDVLAHVLLICAEHFARLALEDPEQYSRERLVKALAGLIRASES